MRQSLATLRALGPFPPVSVALGCVVAVVTYFVGHRVDTSSTSPTPVTMSLHGEAPGPAEFARRLAGLANQFAAETGAVARLERVDCVQGEHRGHYMCSFALLRPPAPAECHLIQAIWTPMQVDSFKVTLSGRALRCGSVREAVRSLQ
jgi:hypothetical protein